MALGGVGTSPQEMATKGIEEQKKWDGVQKTKEEAEIAKFNAQIANTKAIRY
ncbi:hypothetical protein [Pseudomonas sp. B22129]|uniref:hypothetical protein n=1 Tax=Pseudomonas sp. B22129 TaxID=3235111 RepID=UPI00378317FC